MTCVCSGCLFGVCGVHAVGACQARVCFHQRRRAEDTHAQRKARPMNVGPDVSQPPSALHRCRHSRAPRNAALRWLWCDGIQVDRGWQCRGRGGSRSCCWRLQCGNHQKLPSRGPCAGTLSGPVNGWGGGGLLPVCKRLCRVIVSRARLHVCVSACLVLACLRASVHACLRACVPASLRACVPACLRACVSACLRACVSASSECPGSGVHPSTYFHPFPANNPLPSLPQAVASHALTGGCSVEGCATTTNALLCLGADCHKLFCRRSESGHMLSYVG
jgi:hypothetical protein